MSGIEILGTGSYVPEFVADNNKFAEFLDIVKNKLAANKSRI